MGYKLVTAPEVEPVSLVEAKAHLRVDYDLNDDDPLIAGLIVAARQWCEQYTRRAFITQEWRATFDKFGDKMPLAWPTVQSVTDIKYRANDGTVSDGGSPPLSALDVMVYVTSADDVSARVMLRDGAAWAGTAIHPDAVEVTYEAGYGDTPDDVPMAIRQAILLLVGTWYEFRESVSASQAVPTQVPMTVEALLQPYRIVGCA